LPVVLSLIKLYTRSVLYTLRGGKGGLTLLPYDELDGAPQSHTGDNRKIAEAKEQGTGENLPSPEEAATEDGEEDGPWYIGKAREEFNRRRRGRDAQGLRRQEEDPVQWARERRNADSDRDNDYGPEDYFDASLRGGRRGEEEDDEFAETMLLVLLCIAVSVLLYVRGRWAERLRREQAQEQQQGANVQPAAPQQGQGVFPPAGDPARDDWAVLR